MRVSTLLLSLSLWAMIFAIVAYFRDSAPWVVASLGMATLGLAVIGIATIPDESFAVMEDE